MKRIDKKLEGEQIDGLILPAGIDVHVHFRDFEENRKETINSGSLSALFGGICLVVDQPNTNPIVDGADEYKRRMDKAMKESYVDYRLNVALTNRNSDSLIETLKEIEKDYFVPAIGEVFIHHTNPDLQIPYDTLSMIRKSTSKLITVHAEDPALIDEDSTQAEIKSVERCLELGNFHFCHISTYDSAIKISDSESTFEVTPHHLFLSYDDLQNLGSFIRVNPPLRSRVEAEMLFNGLQLADIIASDHAPHTLEDKKDGKPGFPGVETMYPLLIYLMKKGVIGVRTIVKLISSNPARIFGFERYGEIEIGNYANFAVFDLKSVTKIRADKLHTLAEWTPFENFDAIFPRRVYIRGELAIEDGEVKIDPGLHKHEERSGTE